MLLLKVVVSVALIATVLARADIADLGRRLASVSLLTVALGSLGIFAVSFTTAARWKIVLAEFGLPLGFAEVWRYTAIGMFFNQLLPSGMGGDGFRMWYAQRAGLPLGAAISSVVVDRILGFLGMLLLLCIGLPYLLSLRVSGSLAALLAVSAALLAMGIALFLFVDRVTTSAAELLRGKVGASLSQRPGLVRLEAALTRTALNTRRLLAALPRGPTTVLLSLVNQVVLGLVVLQLARSMSLNLSAAGAVFLFPPVLLLSMIPISLAGWGVREGAMVVVFALGGLHAEASLSVSVLYGACAFLSGLPGALLWLLRRPRVDVKDNG